MDIPDGYCQCGCGEKTNISKYNNKKNGHIAGKPVFCIRGHTINRVGRTKPIEERFWKFVDKGKDDECWNWIGAKKDNGYGVIGLGKKLIRAPRLSYTIAYGEIPEGKFICHRCDNPSCVNPKHLFLGTNQDNMNDMCDKGRQLRKLTIEEVKKIKQILIYGNKTQVEIGIMFNVDNTTINKIAKGINWKRV
jgi:hypothetical protein